MSDATILIEDQVIEVTIGGPTGPAGPDTADMLAFLAADEGAANIGTESGESVQDIISRLTTPPGYRANPDPDLDTLLPGFFAYVAGPNNVGLKRQVYELAIAKLAPEVSGDKVYVAGGQPIGTPETEDGLTEADAFNMFAYAMKESMAPFVELIGDPNPSTPRIFYKYDRSNADTAGAVEKIVSVKPGTHAQIREPGPAASDLTFTQDGTLPDLWNAPLAANWQASHNYATLGLFVKNGNYIFYNINDGTSAASGGPLPSQGTPSGLNIVDGGVAWNLAPPPFVVLYRGAPIVSTASKAAADAEDYGFCTVNGVLTLKLNGLNVATEIAAGHVEIIYAWDPFVAGNPETSDCRNRSTTAIFLPPPEGSSLSFRGVSPTASVRISGHGELAIDGGDFRNPRIRIEYTGYGVDAEDSGLYLNAIQFEGTKGDCVHTTGASYGAIGPLLIRRTGGFETFGDWGQSNNDIGTHDGSSFIIAGGDFGFAYGPAIALSGSGKYHVMAFVAHDGQEPGGRIGLYLNGTVECHADSGLIYNQGDGEIFVDTGTTLHTANMSYTVTGTGTVDEYTPTNL